MRLSLSRIEAAQRRLSPVFTDTPQYECEPLSEALGCSVTLKVETANPIRCFKGRGAELAVAEAIDEGSRAVVCASAGNLGQAVAYCARERKIASTVVAARSASRSKLERIRAFGASLRLVDGDIELARETAWQIAESEAATLIEDSENVATCEGAATIGMELTGDGEDRFDAVLLALGGGAMATGVGCVFKRRSPATRVVCVQPSGAPAMTLSWRAGSVIQTESIDTIADGVAGRFPIPEVLSDLLEVADDALLVQEASIIKAMGLLYRQAGLVVEPSAALGIAAVIENPDEFRDKRLASVLCGSNVDLADFHRWVL